MPRLASTHSASYATPDKAAGTQIVSLEAQTTVDATWIDFLKVGFLAENKSGLLHWNLFAAPAKNEEVEPIDAQHWRAELGSVPIYVQRFQLKIWAPVIQLDVAT